MNKFQTINENIRTQTVTHAWKTIVNLTKLSKSKPLFWKKNCLETHYGCLASPVKPLFRPFRTTVLGENSQISWICVLNKCSGSVDVHSLWLDLRLWLPIRWISKEIKKKTFLT